MSQKAPPSYISCMYYVNYLILIFIFNYISEVLVILTLFARIFYANEADLSRLQVSYFYCRPIIIE